MEYKIKEVIECVLMVCDCKVCGFNNTDKFLRSCPNCGANLVVMTFDELKPEENKEGEINVL